MTEVLYEGWERAERQTWVAGGKHLASVSGKLGAKVSDVRSNFFPKSVSQSAKTAKVRCIDYAAHASEPRFHKF